MGKWKRILLNLCCLTAVSILVGCHKELGEAKDFNKLDPNIGTIVGYDQNGLEIIKMNKRPPPIFADHKVLTFRKEGLRPQVKGRLSSGKEYPVLLDSGSSRSIVVQEKHVRENNMVIYPLRDRFGKPRSIGLCLIDKLEIDDLRFERIPGMYIQDTPILRLFGIPIGSGDMVILTLEMMKEFKYVCIDDIEQNVSLSGTELFLPKEKTGWRSYPMAVEPNGKSLLLFISIPVQGQELKLRFDTGSTGGLTFSKKQWDNIASKFPDFKFHFSGKIAIPISKRINCRIGWQDDVNIADSQIPKVHIRMTVEDNQIFNEGDGFIGMECFKNKSIVLDFARNLFWIK